MCMLNVFVSTATPGLFFTSMHNAVFSNLLETFLENYFLFIQDKFIPELFHFLYVVDTRSSLLSDKVSWKQ